MSKKWKYGFDHTTAEGQKRLMAHSMGLDPETYVCNVIDLLKEGDYGCDPLGNEKFKMVPSGDIVDLAEMRRRLKTVISGVI